MQNHAIYVYKYIQVDQFINHQASHKTAMILSERGYAVKERGVIKVANIMVIVTVIVIIIIAIIIIVIIIINIIIIQVKGKGLMRTYFVLGRKISRGRYGKGGSGAANTSLAEVIMMMMRRRMVMMMTKMMLMLMMLTIWEGWQWGC